MRVLIIDDEDQAKLIEQITRVLGRSVEVIYFDHFTHDQLNSAMMVYCELGREREELQSVFVSIVGFYSPNVVLLDYLYGRYGLGEVFEEAIEDGLLEVGVFMHTTTPWKGVG